MQNILEDVIKNVLVTVLSSALIFGLVTLYPIMRKANIIKTIRKYKAPSRRVYIYEGGLDEQSHFSPRKKFKSIFTPEEKNLIVKMNDKVNCYDGIVIRLDSIQNCQCQLSKVGFYDFLSTNLTYKPASNNVRTFKGTLLAAIYDEDYKKVKALENRLKSVIFRYGRLNSFKKVLEVNELANVITVSTMIEDSDENVLIVERANKVAVFSGKFSASSDGTVNLCDVYSTAGESPFIVCAKRSVKRELGLDLQQVRFQRLVMSKQNLQPAALVSGKLTEPLSKLIESIEKRPEFLQENIKAHVVNKKKALRMIRRKQFADVAAYHIYLTCKQERKKK